MEPSHLRHLNPPQRQAVEHIDGPLLVLAGAGSGKTRVLTRRIAHLIHNGVRPWQILAVTFTNKAAGEMKERVVDLVGPQGDRILVSTFHSACARFLRSDIEPLGYTRSFTITDTDDQKRLIKQIAGDIGFSLKDWPVARLLRAIDSAKNQMLDPDQFAQQQVLAAGDPSVQVYRRYESRLRASNAVDFNDLINLVVKLWSEHPGVLARYQDRFRYLLVDEYQDTNRAQYHLVQLLGRKHRNVMVVGDDDQSIYGFRGADVSNILNFKDDFPEAVQVRLEQNYRSTGHILHAANAMVANNTARLVKKLWTDAGDGEPVVMHASRGSSDEARWLVDTVRDLVRQGHAYKDIAVIYRTNAASRAFEQELVRARVPHLLVGARRFYERREVRDLLAYLKLIVNPRDNLSFLRVINVPRRGIGPKAIESIRQEAEDRDVSLLEAARTWGRGRTKVRRNALAFTALIDRAIDAATTLSPSELVTTLVEESGIADQLRNEGTPEAQGRLDNLSELAKAVEEGVAAEAQSAADQAEGDISDDPIARLQAFVDRASLASQADDLPDDAHGQVTLLTAHLAKGLEFPVVFVTGMYEGGFPHFMSLESESAIEEERRLVYVAFTRAQRRLLVTWPRFRDTPGGAPGPVEPSRFIREVPDSAVTWSGGRGGGSSSRESREGRAARLGLAQGRPPRSRERAPLKRTQLRPAVSSSDPVADDLRTVLPDDPSEFQPGVRVLHPQFGLGRIQRRDGSPQNLKLVVIFDQHGRKVLFARHARLVIVIP